MSDIDHTSPGFDLSSHWTLDPAIRFLNHGSFGATPSRVLHEQQEIRARMEREPVDFFVRKLPAALDRARCELAEFVGAEPANLAFVPNTTTGVNAVLRSLELEPGDEILVTDHGYPACNNAVDFVADRAGAKVVVAEVPFPIASADEVVDAVLDEVTDNTRLALIDHVTSATALIFPVEQIIEALSERGVDTLIDGAHAPGMLPLELESLGATYYTGNCHKWLCSPKGAGFLWVDERRRDGVRPAVISHGAGAPRGERFHPEFDWTGTHDFSPYLCVPTAISFLKSLMPGGWPAIYARNNALAIEARDLLCETLEVDAPAPDDMLGPMATVPLPDADYDPPEGSPPVDPVEQKLFEEADFELRIVAWSAYPTRFIRVCCQLYNTLEEYEELCELLPKALAGEKLLEEGDLPVY
ncbi:MAG: aminotransferase class V-fold PLP-dependent enzyme [Persicimonas sp.]